MNATRMAAFTDGVIAIIITIMVLELRVPEGGSFAALRSALPILSAYVLAFLNVGLYWNNHHHMLQVTRHIDGRVLWTNMLLLFWLSLVPFVIRWLNATQFASVPTAAYGVVMGMAAISYALTARAIIACNGMDSLVARALGRDWKGKATLIIYAFAIPMAFINRFVALVGYVAVILLWFIPDRRMERAFADAEQASEFKDGQDP